MAQVVVLLGLVVKFHLDRKFQCFDSEENYWFGNDRLVLKNCEIKQKQGLKKEAMIEGTSYSRP